MDDGPFPVLGNWLDKSQPGPDQRREGNAFGEAQGFIFSIKRTQPVMPLGITLDPSGSQALHVCTVSAGTATAVYEANQQAPSADRELLAGDYITEVNGLSDDLSEMLNEALAKNSIVLRVLRPEEYDISVCRWGGPLGCGITYDERNGRSLVIESINDGAVSAWNAANPEKKVRVGDRIVAANSKSGSASELLHFIRTIEGEMTLRFSRPATLPLSHGTSS